MSARESLAWIIRGALIPSVACGSASFTPSAPSPSAARVAVTVVGPLAIDCCNSDGQVCTFSGTVSNAGPDRATSIVGSTIVTSANSRIEYARAQLVTWSIEGMLRPFEAASFKGSGFSQQELTLGLPTSSVRAQASVCP
jgi:hypothetical protein